MKQYYKQGGFFDRLERFSDWIDFGVYRIESRLKLYGLMYFIPGFRKISVTRFWVDDALLEVEFAKRNLEKQIATYNREKYWWMSSK